MDTLDVSVVTKQLPGSSLRESKFPLRAAMTTEVACIAAINHPLTSTVLAKIIIPSFVFYLDLVGLKTNAFAYGPTPLICACMYVHMSPLLNPLAHLCFIPSAQL